MLSKIFGEMSLLFDVPYHMAHMGHMQGLGFFLGDFVMSAKISLAWLFQPEPRILDLN